MPETTPQVIARLLKQGGIVLIVGGGVSKLPLEYHEHPQIRLWDDNAQGINRDVPSNTRAIIFNRWVSHPTAGRLRRAAIALHIPVFPLLRTRELKDLCMELMHEVPPTEPILALSTPSVDTIGTPTVENVEAPVETPELATEETMRKPVRGEIAAFVREHADFKTDSFADEARRLLKLLKTKGIKSTFGSLAQCVRVEAQKAKRGGEAVVTPKKVKDKKQPTVSVTSLDFDLDEAVKLLENAKTAIDLLVEFVPKLQQEVQRQRDRMKMLREMLG